MISKRQQLAAQRAALVNQAAFQRIELTESFQSISKPVKFLDQGLFAIRYLKKHPMIVAGSLALALVVRPNRWVKLLENGWLAWRLALAAKRRLES